MKHKLNTPEERIKAITDNPELIINQLFNDADSVVFRDDNTPTGCFSRKYKNGKIEHFRRDENGHEILVNYS
ncbi:hypothetical protein ACUMKS_003550 [Proteus mirabilis]|uniref:hypothetical protein n=1 Tax=Proteus mirabilis TaxID=584 RepID=UPI001A2F6F27|nr:hypothetical protein [Proteus mirabilis]HEM8286031.1 hypothetical protein [Providencia stuartii]EKU3803947.1 hypothetical protein [Proteus mirabilis]EKV7963190.1 hypothetical protein [Proteus mirabilis]ELB1171919.1 hypothetical protein [Proteus mirabilis]ELB2631278.1 hypothetical protein [Proteus mirabilis]